MEDDILSSALGVKVWRKYIEPPFHCTAIVTSHERSLRAVDTMSH